MAAGEDAVAVLPRSALRGVDDLRVPLMTICLSADNCGLHI